MSRWTLMLSDFDLKYVPLKVIKGRAVADFLADNPIEETEVVDTWSFPDEDIVHIENDTWDLYFDGGIELQRILDRSSTHLARSMPTRFAQCYRVGHKKACSTWGFFIGNQSSGRDMKTQSDSLAPYQARIEELEKSFVDVKYVHLPRDENQFADALSKLAALINMPDQMDSMPLCVEQRSSPTYVNAIEDAEETEAEPWYQAILKFKESEEYTPNTDNRENRANRMLAAQFIRTSDGQLYKKTTPNILL
ncbi:uncharacterized protein LOC141627527 [Silene latifolia]|uniref:uncharacterized protein LOC141627527 n=1 Tax=Silene latifolia TaxID=37657 RepID=UPI003D7749EC